MPSPAPFSSEKQTGHHKVPLRSGLLPFQALPSARVAAYAVLTGCAAGLLRLRLGGNPGLLADLVLFALPALVSALLWGFVPALTALAAFGTLVLESHGAGTWLAGVPRSDAAAGAVLGGLCLGLLGEYARRGLVGSRELARSLESLRASDEQLRQFIRHAPVSLAMFDREMRYIAASRGWLESHELEDIDLTGRLHYEVFPSLSEAWKDVHRRALSGETVRNRRDRVVRADGWVQWLRWEVLPWRNAQGEIGGILIASEDITEQVVTMDELRRHRQLLQETGQIAKVGGWEFDTATGAGTWTDEVARIHDLDPNSPTTRELGLSFYKGESRERVAEAVKAAIEQARPYDLELELISAKGAHKWVRTIGHPIIEDGKVVRVRGSFQDITEHKRIEEEIRQLNAELEHRVARRTAELEAANRELEAFSYSVSHDLRAPLRSIDGFSQVLLEDCGDKLSPEGLRYVQTIRRGAQRMGTLIDDLLALSRLGRASMSLRTVDMEQTVQSALAELRQGLDGRVVEVRCLPLPSCQGDPTLLRQVWLNLLSNAFKYTGRKAQAEIEIGCQQGAAAPVYYVRDNGTGFDMRYAHKLFGVFQRLHRAEDFEGTGVGLAIVHRLVTRHKGRVWADAAVDRGATFFFTINENTPS